jgi:hypothetical protein
MIPPTTSSPAGAVRSSCPARAVSIAFLALILAGTSSAVGAEPADSPLRAGAWALEFELDPEYSYALGFSGAATISAKRMWTERTGLRFGATLGYVEEDSDGESVSFESTPTNPSGVGLRAPSGEGRESHSYALFAHLRRHHPVRERLSIHWELGPSFRYQEYESWYENHYSYGPSYSYSREMSTRRGVFLDARIGFEWLFARRLALGASYGAYGGYQWGSGTYTREARTDDGLYSYSDQDFQSLRRADFSTSRATVSFTAYL